MIVKIFNLDTSSVCVSAEDIECPKDVELIYLISQLLEEVQIFHDKHQGKYPRTITDLFEDMYK